jgi:hypothetical protein
MNLCATSSWNVLPPKLHADHDCLSHTSSFATIVEHSFRLTVSRNEALALTDLVINLGIIDQKLSHCRQNF